MSRGRHGGTLLLLVIVAITALAIVALADDGEASWSGEPLPPWGSDWYINQDTVYKDETIRLDGTIYVNSPNTFSMDGCTLIFNGTYNGDNGIYVSWGAVLYINDSASNDGVVKANVSAMDWGFYFDGEVYLNDVELMDIDYGIWNYNTYLYMEGCTIHSTHYGIISYADAHVGNSTINVVNPGPVGYLETIGFVGIGGTYGLYNLDINLRIDLNETYNSTYYYGYYYSYGIYIIDGDVGLLEPGRNREFSISIDLDVVVENYYVTSSYVTFYNRFYTSFIRLEGSTVCKGINDIKFDVDEDVTCVSYNATRGARIYKYNYDEYLYTSISSSGEGPAEVSGLVFDGFYPNLHTMGEVYALYDYMYNSAIEIRDSDGAQPDDAIIEFHDIVVKNSMYDLVFYLPRYGEWSMRDCVFENIETMRLLELYYTDMDYSVSYCDFIDITAASTSATLFRLYRNEGEGQFLNNTFRGIEGARLFEMYYPQDRIYFQFNTFDMNVQWESVSYTWFYIYQSQDRVLFRWNTFNNSEYPRGFIYTAYTQDKIIFEGNDVMDNQVGEYLFYSYYNYADIDIVENNFHGNTGPLLENDQVRGRWTVADNTFSENHAGADYLLHTYYAYAEMKITDNRFENNTADGALLFFRGATYFSSIDFAFDRNTLIGNTASSALNGGIVVFRGVRYDIAARRNVFRENTGTCINFYRPYTSNSWYAYTHTVDGNLFFDNDGTATTWIDYRSYNIVVKRNEGSGNSGPLIWHHLTASYVYDTFYPNCIGDMSGALSIEVSSNNWSYNTGGGIILDPAQWHDASIIYNNYEQQILLSNNILQFNEGDWSIMVEDFGRFPLLVNNDIWGSQYGVFLQAIDYPAAFDRVLMTFNGEEFDGGGPNGMTAWALVNVDADFTDCTFTNFKEAIYARDCTVNVYWSAIPEGSGRTEGRGYIYVWNNLEILITWSDAMGVDSMQPAAGARLAMLGTNGRYSGDLIADDDGLIGPLLISPWSSIEGKMDQGSPYQGTIFSGGLTAQHTINVIGEQVGGDALHLIIQDTAVPDVVVTSPLDGSMSNMVDMPVEGFLFETGSGIESFMGYLDGGMGVEVDPGQTWMAMFNDLEQGEHTILFEAVDIAQNEANTTVTFLIDAVAPQLDIVSPEDGDSTRDPNQLVQGSYQDDVSDLQDIEVRINGVTISGTTGVVNEYVTLTEGVNTIVIDATDLAGNTLVVRRTVTLDSYPPTLYVYSPLDMMVTADDMLQVDGLSEGGTPVQIEQIDADSGSLISTVTVDARADGVFRHTLELQEGEQYIVFTAQDPAGNVRTVTRTVSLDTMAPGLTINSPGEGDYISGSFVPLVAQVDEDATVYVNGIPVDHAGFISVNVSLVEGVNTIVVMAVDSVDNTANRMVNITRDTIPPMLDVETPEFVLTNIRQLVIRGTVDDDANTVTVGGTPVNIDEDLKFSVEVDLGSVDKPIVVVAEDMADNTASHVIDFVFDNQAPEINLVDQPGAETEDLVIMLNGTVTDNEAVIDYITVRGHVYPVVSGKFNVLLTVDTAGEGWNNFTISVTDDAGNTAVENINVQYIPPDVEIKDDETEDNLWWYYGILLIIAAVVIMMTIFVFAKRGEE